MKDKTIEAKTAALQAEIEAIHVKLDKEYSAQGEIVNKIKQIPTYFWSLANEKAEKRLRKQLIPHEIKINRLKRELKGFEIQLQNVNQLELFN
jgi:hypothetical protein